MNLENESSKRASLVRGAPRPEGVPEAWWTADGGIATLGLALRRSRGPLHGVAHQVVRYMYLGSVEPRWIRRYRISARCGVPYGDAQALSIDHSLSFLRQYLRKPDQVGAFAPSSRSLAAALCKPYRQHRGPARVLEAGAGTGPITRYLGGILREGDSLDVCEIDPKFAEILRRDVLTNADFAPAVAAGRVRLLNVGVQEINADGAYDYVISGLPLTAFSLGDVQIVMASIRRYLKPGGVFSYFEYVGLRRASQILFTGERRVRYRSVSGYLSENIRRHQYDRETVLRNFPPAHARHLRFDAEVVAV